MAEDRRQFLSLAFKRVARMGMEAAGAVNEIAPTAPPAKKYPPPPIPPPVTSLFLNKLDGMTYSRLGRTNLMMSRLALEASAIRPQNLDVVSAAVDAGINFILTARNWGDSEVALGQMLYSIRDRVWLATQTPPFSASLASELLVHEEQESRIRRVFNENLESSLARLAAEHLDVFILQGVDQPDIFESHALRDCIARAREANQIRFMGVSAVANVRSVMTAAIRSALFDVLLVPMNHLNLSSMHPLLDEARFKQVGVIGIYPEVALYKPPEANLMELEPGLTPEQLQLMYLLRQTSHAGYAIAPTSTVELRKSLSIAARPIGINDGNELDSIVYEDYWPDCEACGHKHGFSESLFESLNHHRLAKDDFSGLLDKTPHPQMFCESCEVRARQQNAPS